MAKNSQSPLDTDLLRDLGALIEQAQKPNSKVIGNIEVAAARMQAVKQITQLIQQLFDKLVHFQHQRDIRITQLQSQIRETQKRVTELHGHLERTYTQSRNLPHGDFVDSNGDIRSYEETSASAIRGTQYEIKKYEMILDDLRQQLKREEHGTHSVENLLNKQISEQRALLNQILGLSNS